MRRTKALTMYLIAPCLPYVVVFVIVVTQLSAVVETSTLRQSRTVFAAITAAALLVKRNELSAER